MNAPTSTYRIQLSPEFNFENLKDIINYLDDFGITAVYSAPFFQAREGSTHGYDVVDPLVINSEIGSFEEFKDLRASLSKRKMGWLQDIVPNHMAFDGQNLWLRDIFELGPKSQYYRFFDIDWEYKGWCKVMAPFLGDPLQKVLAKGELQLCFGKNGLTFDYFDQSYPVSMQTYSGILAKAGTADYNQKLADVENDTGSWQELKLMICSGINGNEALRNQLQSTLAEINESPEKLTEELELQYFKPTFWKHTEKEINYRRFFTVNDLICMCMEDLQVFNTYHQFIKTLVKGGLITGLRLDHIDGLFDPAGYFKKLRELVGEDFYIVAEKILEKDEKLPQNWPVQGTSGYGFLASVNQLLTEQSKTKNFDAGYTKLVPELSDFETLTFQKKLFIFKQRMDGELQNLVSLLEKLDLLPEKETFKRENIKEALAVFLAAFPVYRIYPHHFPLNDEELYVVKTAYDSANHHVPEYRDAIDYLKSLFIGKAEKNVPDMLYFLKRCQQFTGPLAAKGGEDTSFYIYNRLISHNEVGDSPGHFGISIDDFHKEMQYRKEHFPNALNATASHDTKRGEDARMRLNVLSEIPEEWFGLVEQWNAVAKKIRKTSNAPDANETYFIYQMLIGALPSAKTVDESFLERTKAYLQKAGREAKINTNWAEPDLEHEENVFEFVKDVLANEEFQKSFTPFLDKIIRLGAIKSLSQILIKITAPGVPDIYQGTELWELSYVDPDNRRPVDYEFRKNTLEDFKHFSEENSKKELLNLRNDFLSGRIKMYVMYKALLARKAAYELFAEGDYLPLEITGRAGREFMGFARVKNEKWSITVVPLLVSEYFKWGALLPDQELLKQSQLILPEEAPEKLYNHFTREHIASAKTLSLSVLFAHFPVALLSNTQ